MIREDMNSSTNAIVDALSKGDLSALDQFYASECLWHRPPYTDIHGLDAYKTFVAGFLTVFPDAQFTIRELLSGDETVFARLDWQGTHRGRLPDSARLSMPPLGAKIGGPGCLVFHWSDGRIVEQWDYWDELGFWQQLGFQLAPPALHSV